MKNSLEYKVLKYLADNDSEDNVDITKFFKNDIRVARRTLKALRDEHYIFYFERAMPFDEDGKFFAKIEFKGLKYLESIKPKPLTLFQKTQLFTTILSISVAVTFGILNYLLSSQKSELESQNSILKTNILQYKDSINAYKEQSLLKNKQALHEKEPSNNYHDSNNEKDLTDQ